MNADEITKNFNKVAVEYDSQRRKFIPCFDDYYFTSIQFLSSLIREPKAILDLGAGTGLLSSVLFTQYPNAKYTLLDVSEKMLDVAKERFAGSKNFEYRIGDYSCGLCESKFDLIASALSIHHLDDEGKSALYQDIFRSLEHGGFFINIDQFNAGSEYMERKFADWWYHSIKNSGLSTDEYDMWIERRKLDKENTIEETKEMLSLAGFCRIECIYAYMKFGVVVAQKPIEAVP